MKSRVLSNNLTCVCYQKVSPLVEVVDLIVNCCCCLPKMGEASTKDKVMDSADDILVDTIHADWLFVFCKLRNIKKMPARIVGSRWYTNFMRRHGDKIKCKPCSIQDQNRQTWCTIDNFKNMYTALYKAMVEAGIALNYDEEVMLGCERNMRSNDEKMFGNTCIIDNNGSMVAIDNNKK
jgi:hypothetical protein